MGIKFKLAIGQILLFAVISALALVSGYYTNRLATDSGKIIKDNYASLEYCREMQKSIDQIHQFYLLNLLNTNTSSNSFQKLAEDRKKTSALFEKYFQEEMNNLTESGEREAAVNLRHSYEDYFDSFDSALNKSGQASQDYLINMIIKYNAIKNNLNDIFNINLNAMNRKSNVASNTGHQALVYVSVLGTIAFLISFTFLLSIPSSIGNPIIEVTKKMKAIASRNYNEHIDVRSKDELGEMALAFNTMAKKLRDYEKSTMSELITEKSRIEAIVNNLNEGIILIDENHKVVTINPVAGELLGTEAKDINGKHATEVALHNDLLRELIRNLGSSEKDVNNSLRITVGKEENFFIKEVYKIDRLNPEIDLKEHSGYLITLRNVTEFKKLDLAKTNFISIISHELKTPLSSISLSIKLLEDERIGLLNEGQIKLLNSVKSETLRLSRISKELLDVSQVETGHIKLQITEEKPEDIVKFSTDAIRTQLEDKQLELVTNFSENLPGVKADLEKTVWVMTNILANAIRYSPDGGKIVIAIVPSQEFVQFSVEDNGPGIEQKNLKRIFERFVQIGGAKKGEGIGLGLAISKDFIQEQGGNLWVESELGIGSKFIFTLPVG